MSPAESRYASGVFGASGTAATRRTISPAAAAEPACGTTSLPVTTRKPAAKSVAMSSSESSV